MLSHRSRWGAPQNAISLLRRQLSEEGRDLLDLTVSNPTRAHFDYPDDELQRILGKASRAPYDPDPRGLLSAREALAEHLSAPGDAVSPQDLFLTASTSESYSFLFKLLADPSDNVLTAAPSYPLLAHLAELEGIESRHYAVHYMAREGSGHWATDERDILEQVDRHSRALVVVHPGNPTGHYISRSEQEKLETITADRGIAMISDEVFFGYPLDVPDDIASTFASGHRTLSFSLGGLSKSAGLPHWKLGWIRIGGTPAQREEAANALEVIADTFLSVSTAVQVALPEVLQMAPALRGQISARTRANLEVLRREIASRDFLQLLTPEGGWVAVIRTPRLESDEAAVMAMMREESVFVQPGWFYDFETEGHFVFSLLTPEETFREGVGRVMRYFERVVGS